MKNMELVEKLSENENTVKNNAATNGNAEKELGQMRKEYEILQETINFLESDAEASLAPLQQQIDQQEIEINTLREKASNSTVFADEISFLKDQVDTLEEEKDVLHQQLQTANATNGENGDQNMLQQIDFLNSIIADNQDKLKQKESEIKELEKLILNGAVDEAEMVYNEYHDGSGEAAGSARAYCDICEVFDEHDTEQCPIQGGDNGEKSYNHVDLKTYNFDGYDDDETF